MVETLTGTRRSGGVPYDSLLDADSHPVRPILRETAPLPPGPTKIPADRYYAPEFHRLEVERLWKRVWQMACHEDDIPAVGDYHVYDIAGLSYLVVRCTQDEIRAFPNVCLHRGRILKECSGKGAREFRCPFHGWAWKLDGSLHQVPCAWDFPTVSAEDYGLPAIKVGRWGGMVFINPDVSAEPLEAFLGNLSDQFTLLPYERRYKAVHVAKRLRCNWKLAQEAFMESYHVVATHPTILGWLGDANSKYDVFGNYSRAISPQDVMSPHANPAFVTNPPEGAREFTKLRHALSGMVFERLDQGRVLVTASDGRTGTFDERGNHLGGEIRQADPQMCNWIGGKQLPDVEDMPARAINAAPDARAKSAAARREELRGALGDQVDGFSDAELIDSIYLSLFPNLSPWGSFNPIVYRFRPDGENPEQSIHEIMYFLPVPVGQPRPAPTEVHWLGLDDDYVDAPQLGALAKVFNQDSLNLPLVQKGLKSLKSGEVILADYQETKIRHFHMLLEKWLEI